MRNNQPLRKKTLSRVLIMAMLSFVFLGYQNCAPFKTAEEPFDLASSAATANEPDSDSTSQPVSTPEPTAIPSATPTPAPTATPVATPVATPKPTASPTPTPTPIATRELRVMFVGNSLTGHNNLPGLFKALANKNGHAPYVEVSIKFSKGLDSHLASATLKDSLAKNKFDYLVLQEYSDRPLVDPAKFKAGVIEFQKLVAGTGTKVVLFENWVYKSSPAGEMDKMDAAYLKVAKETGVSIVYVGRAQTYVKTSSNINLYSDDKHPTPATTYLTAALFLQYFYALNPTQLQHLGSKTTTGSVESGQTTLPPIIDLDALIGASSVLKLQDAALKFRN